MSYNLCDFSHVLRINAFMRVVTITKVSLIMFHLPLNLKFLGENLVGRHYGEHNKINALGQEN